MKLNLAKLKAFKKSRYYIFDSEENYWYKDSNGEWTTNSINCKFSAPWDENTDEDIIRHAIESEYTIRCFTKEKFLEYKFIENI